MYIYIYICMYTWLSKVQYCTVIALMVIESLSVVYAHTWTHPYNSPGPTLLRAIRHECLIAVHVICFAVA